MDINTNAYDKIRSQEVEIARLEAENAYMLQQLEGVYRWYDGISDRVDDDGLIDQHAVIIPLSRHLKAGGPLYENRRAKKL